MANGIGDSKAESKDTLTLDSVRESLIRQEDSIIFSLIERARFPINSRIFDDSVSPIPGFSGSLARYIVQETEALHAKAGRYESQEENPFFPENLPSPLVPAHNYPKVLHPIAASININKSIWVVYYNEVLPLFAAEGDDGNYALAAARDVDCLQAISRRIHFGKFVAEVKFMDAPSDYEPAIRAQDKDALMKLLTFESVEEAVKRRVESKAMIFAQEVKLVDDKKDEKYKINPSMVSRLFGEWIIPMTKLVQVEYLLRRLDESSQHSETHTKLE